MPIKRRSSAKPAPAAGPVVCAGSGCAFMGWAGACGLPEPARRRMSGLWRANRYRRGDILFYQGNEPLSLHFLCSGLVKLVRTDGAGRERILRVLAAPDVVGDRALLAGHPYAASAQVMGEARVCSIDAARFSALWREEAELPRMFARHLAHKLAEADEAATDLALRTIRERLAKVIASRLAGSGGRVELSESRHELADLLGTTPEAISRALSELERKGIISVDDRRLGILDEARLRSVARLPAGARRHPDFCRWPHKREMP